MLRIVEFKQGTFFSIFLKKIKLTKVLFVLFLVGMVYGAMLVSLNQEEALKQLGSLMQKFIDKRAEQSIVITFFSSFISSMFLIIVLFILGFFSIGQPCSFFIPLFHGLGLGLSSAYLYSCRGIQGIFFCLVLIAPSAIISTFTLLLGAKESIRFSNKNFKTLFPKKYDQDMQGALKIYVTKFLVLSLFQLISAFVDMIFTFLFARFF